MPRSFAVCRPYKTRFRKRVFGFLEDLEFEMRQGAILVAGTPDDTAAHWLSRQNVDLLLLPFHLHRGAAGEPLDGVGVALLLPQHFDRDVSPILMPVSKYSWEASYHRRMSLLKERRPLLAQRIIAMQEHEVGSTQIARALGSRFREKPTKAEATETRALHNFPKTNSMRGRFDAARDPHGVRQGNHAQMSCPALRFR